MVKYIPKPHQAKAIDLVFNSENGLNNFDRTQLIMACGTGKTFTSLQIAQKNINNKKSSITVMLFPSLYLIDQTKKEWEQQTDINSFKNPLVICSDDTIGKNEEDDIFEIDKEEVDYTVTTNYEKIKEYLSKNLAYHQLIFSTYHSSHLLGKALVELKLKADLTLYDEAHKTAIVNRENNIRSMGYALNNDYFPSDKRLFMTATVKHYVTRDDNEIEVFSMNDKELFGEISFEYSLRDAISDGNIADYRIIGIIIDSEYVDKFREFQNLSKEKTKDGSFYSLKSELRAIKIKVIEEAMKRYKINTGLSFHRTIEDSKYFAKNYKNSDISIEHIDGTMNHKKRAQVINKLEIENNYIVSNSRLLTEGVDIPDIGMVFLDKNMSSKVDITQLVGRVQRISKKNPNKIGYIILPLFIDDLSKLDMELDRNEELRTLFDIINNFRHIDTQLREEIQAKRVSNITQEQWGMFYDEVLDFKIKFGRLPLNNSNDYQEQKLFDWIELQKKYAKQNILSWNKMEKLHSLDEFTFPKRAKINLIKIDSAIDSEIFDNSMELVYEKLETVVLNKNIIVAQDEYIKATKEFIELEGIENLKSYTLFKGLNIGQYRMDRKKAYNKIECSRLKEEMILEYSHLHPDYLLSALEISIKNHTSALIDFIQKFGFENLNGKTKHNGFNIGSFRDDWRKKYKKALNKEKIEMMEKFKVIHEDFLLDTKYINYRNNFNATLEFVKKHGYKNLVSRLEYKGFKLGMFRDEMRRKFKKSNKETQKEMLDEFSVIHEDYLYDSSYNIYKEHIDASIEYVQKYGLEKLANLTEYKGLKIGGFRCRLKLKFNALETLEEKNSMIEEYSVIHPDYLLEAVYIRKRDNINATVEFIKEYGYDKLTNKTIYKGYKIGSFRANSREKFKKLSKDEQKKWIEEFSVISDDFLFSKRRDKK